MIQNATNSKKRSSWIRRASWGSIITGVLAIVACELPVLLAALGFTGLSAGAMGLRAPAFVEQMAIIIAALGVLTLLLLVVLQLFSRRGGSNS